MEFPVKLWRGGRIRWRLMVDRLGTLLLAGFLALIVWVYAVNQENPLIQRLFPEPIPVSVRGLSEGLLPVQDVSAQTVILTVRAPQRIWNNLRATDFDVYLDLTGLGVGEHDVRVVAQALDPQVEILSTQPDELRVRLDRVISKEMPVRVTLMDTPAVGFDAQTPVVEPVTVTVTGPEARVNQVVSARAEVFLHSARSQVDRMQSVILHNAQNQPVPQVTPAPGFVSVVVPVEQRPGRKEVAVRPNLVGQPAAGYRLNTVQVNPSTVVLLGSNEVLGQVPGFVETEQISIEGAKADVERRLQLAPPAGVTVSGENSVLVTASLVAIEGGTTVKLKPIIQGLGEGLDASVAIDTVEVILNGPIPLLDSLEPDDMFVFLNLAGLLPGTHAVTPEVVVPDGIRQQGVLPETVEVVITARPTPTPAATATPASTPTATAEPTASPSATRPPIGITP